jgi:hypothetical protein
LDYFVLPRRSCENLNISRPFFLNDILLRKIQQPLLLRFDGSAVWAGKQKFKFSQLLPGSTRYPTRAIITHGLYTFYPLFEVHLCTVTFGLMYG